MGMKKKVKGMVVGGIALGLLVSGTGIKDASASSKKEIPTIFVHGYLGNSASLSGLVGNLSNAKKDSNLYYKYTYKKFGIKAEGKVDLTYSGQRMTYVVPLNEQLVPLDMAKTNGKAKGKKGYRNDYSVIHFENHSMSLNDQEKYLNAVAKAEAKRLKTDRVNIVGHSMGGLLGAQYMIHASQGITSTKVANLVTVGSPIKGGNYTDAMILDTIGGSRAYFDLKDGGKVLKDAFKSKKNLNGTRVLSIGSEQDGLVTYKSATALGGIVNASKFKSYKVKSGHTTYFDGAVGKDIAKKVAGHLN